MAANGEDGVAEEGVRQRELGTYVGDGSRGVGLRNTTHTWIPRPHLDTEALLGLCWQHLAPAEERGDAPEEGRLRLPGSSCREPWAWARVHSSLLHTEQISPTHSLQSYTGQPECAV